MNGFAPLVEGFLAFALTMLAMTAGVSSIVGALHRLRRRHARGLRDMVRLLYDRELVQRLGSAWLVPPPEAADPAQGDAKAASSREPAPAPNPAERAAAFAIDVRAEFIYDMTFMPVPDVVEKLKSKGTGYWRQKLASAERLVGAPWYTTFFHPKRMARRWKTLRYGLEALPDAEFKERLTKSDVGIELQNQLEMQSKLADWDAVAADLLRSFQTIGGASSETFARHSRGWSVAVGFLLAAALNADSLDLLNSYLTNPAVRQQVLSQSDAILQQVAPPANQQGATPPTGQQAGTPPTDQQGANTATLTRLDTATSQLAETAKGLKSAIDSLAPKLDGDGKRAAEALGKQLDGVLSNTESVKTGIGDLTEAEQKIRGVTRSLSSSFPIGWKRFPNCSSADSPDLRCAGRLFKFDPNNQPWWHTVSATAAGLLPDRSAPR